MGDWAVEVEGGKPFDVKVGKDEVLLLQDAYLIGKSKEMNGILRLEVITDKGEKFLITYLHPEKWPHQDQGLVFPKNFQIYHECSSHSVRCIGSKVIVPRD